jgi:type I restriction enzyme S subunit
MTLVVSFEDLFANETKLLAKHESWDRVELGEVCEVLNGFAFKSAQFNKSEGFPVVRIRDLMRGTTGTFYKGDYSSQYIVENGDLLVGMDGNFGCYEWSGGEALLNQRVCKLIPRDGYLDRKFLLFVINGYLKAIEEATSSVTVAHLSSRDIQRIPLPFPSLNEQGRIVAKLEKLLSRVHGAQTRLEAIPRILKRFRQSVLAAACSGRLTTDWRKLHLNVMPAGGNADQLEKERARDYDLKCKNAKLSGIRKPRRPANLDEKVCLEELGGFVDLPDEWIYVPLAKVSSDSADSIVDGPFGTAVNTKTDYVNSGVPVVRINNIHAFGFDSTNLKYISEAKFDQLERHKITPGDVLLTKVGTIGDSCVFPSNYAKALLSTTGSCKISVDTRIANNQYVCLYLNHLKPFLNSIASEAVQAFLNMKTIKSVPLALPPLLEQLEIVRRVEALFKTADALEARYRKAKAQVDKLTQSILAKAFRGELVPQGPTTTRV